MPFQYRAQGHHLAVLVRQGEIRGPIEGGLGFARGVVTGATRQQKHHEHQGGKRSAIHGPVSFMNKGLWLIGVRSICSAVCV